MKIIILVLILILIAILLFPNKKNKTFYTIDETYPWLKKLSSNNNLNLIYTDLNNVKNTDWQEWPEHYLWKNNDDQNSWTIFPIKAFGKWSNKNIKLCPNIYKLLKNNEDVINVGFSRLSAGTVLDKHYGWANLSNHVLRCHLGLIIPGSAHIYCENDKKKQIRGEWIVFDDSKLHYADNLGTSDRIVLILDIKRPNNVKLGNSTVLDSNELLGFIKEFELNK